MAFFGLGCGQVQTLEQKENHRCPYLYLPRFFGSFVATASCSQGSHENTETEMVVPQYWAGRSQHRAIVAHPNRAIVGSPSDKPPEQRVLEAVAPKRP